MQNKVIQSTSATLFYRLTFKPDPFDPAIVAQFWRNIKTIEFSNIIIYGIWNCRKMQSYYNL